MINADRYGSIRPRRESTLYRLCSIREIHLPAWADQGASLVSTLASSNVNDDMWAHRSKTTERAVGVVGETASIHLFRAVATYSQSEAWARAISLLGHLFALLMARATEEGRDPSSDRRPRHSSPIIENNAIADTHRGVIDQAHPTDSPSRRWRPSRDVFWLLREWVVKIGVACNAARRNVTREN